LTAIMPDDSNETWLIEEGAQVAERIAAAGGYASLTLREQFVRCLWAADYGMRNAGDLTTAADVYPDFLKDGRAAAQTLGLPQSTAAFSLSVEQLEARYFAVFDGVIDEVRAL
jgi:hypothetical protein